MRAVVFTCILVAGLSVAGVCHGQVAVADWNPKSAVPIDGSDLATVHLDGSGSYHPDAGRTIVAWTWRIVRSVQSYGGEQFGFAVDMSSYAPYPPQGITLTFRLTVTDDLSYEDSVDFDVTFNTLSSSPPDIAFAPDGVSIYEGEGFSVSGAGTTDPDGDWFATVAWDIDGDDTDDITRYREDTNTDGEVNELDDDPSLGLALTWTEMGTYTGL
ncbi:MAG: hypothetical protein GY851_18770 [bacterium]|nr:hypothetical protein [bacterium]